MRTLASLTIMVAVLPGLAWAQETVGAGAAGVAPIVQPAPAALSTGAVGMPGAAAGAVEIVPGALDVPATTVFQPAGSAGPLLPDDIQVVRFHGPSGVIVEILGPQPAAMNFASEDGLLTAGLRVGVGYWARLSNLPDRPGQSLYAMVEIAGHLHRPPGMDPTRHPVRIPMTADDIDDVLVRGRMVTEIVYLEDQDQAIPLSLPKNEIPVVGLTPSEDPIKVAEALGRVFAIVRLGLRVPSDQEIQGGWSMLGGAGVPCPFLATSGNPCEIPCSAVVACAPAPGRKWLPKDEYLCDGGDRDSAGRAGGSTAVQGVDPRDAIVRFEDRGTVRVLPTNVVCVYAPRFAAVRQGLGVNESQVVEVLQGASQYQRQVIGTSRQSPRPLTQNQTLEANRYRSRPSGLSSRLGPLNHTELRILDGLDLVEHLKGHALTEPAQVEATRQKLEAYVDPRKLEGIATGEGVVVTGIVMGAGEKVMAWKPQEVASVEEPPKKPGLVVMKQVSAAEASPGDELTYTITYRNMGNVPIRAVSVIDSLLPRLEYVPGSAKGPAGAVFTAGANGVGSTELRWDVGTLPPGSLGAVSFQAKVR